MKLFGPIEANNTGQMVPQARSIREGNDTNAAAARNSTQTRAEGAWPPHQGALLTCFSP